MSAPAAAAAQHDDPDVQMLRAALRAGAMVASGAVPTDSQTDAIIEGGLDEGEAL